MGVARYDGSAHHVIGRPARFGQEQRLADEQVVCVRETVELGKLRPSSCQALVQLI
jgi:hypothetical protein